MILHEFFIHEINFLQMKPFFMNNWLENMLQRVKLARSINSFLMRESDKLQNETPMRNHSISISSHDSVKEIINLKICSTNRKITSVLERIPAEFNGNLLKIDGNQPQFLGLKKFEMNPRDFLTEKCKIKKFLLNFETPTRFGNERNSIPNKELIPLPEIILHDLGARLERNGLLPSNIDILKFSSWMKKNVSLSSFSIKTIPEKKVIGFYGWAKYIVHASDNKMLSTLNYLLNLARYWNLGIETEKGLGSVKIHLKIE